MQQALCKPGTEVFNLCASLILQWLQVWNPAHKFECIATAATAVQRVYALLEGQSLLASNDCGNVKIRLFPDLPNFKRKSKMQKTQTFIKNFNV